MKMLKRLFKVESTTQLFLVFIVFSVTGFGALYIAKPLMGWVGINEEGMPWYAFWPLRIIFMMTAYQIMLIFFGTLFGQFEYFWRMEKRILKRFGIRLK